MVDEDGVTERSQHEQQIKWSWVREVTIGHGSRRALSVDHYISCSTLFPFAFFTSHLTSTSLQMPCSSQERFVRKLEDFLLRMNLFPSRQLNSATTMEDFTVVLRRAQKEVAVMTTLVRTSLQHHKVSEFGVLAVLLGRVSRLLTSHEVFASE